METAITFQPRPTTGLPRDEALRVVRLNCLGSLYYFIKIGLRRKRLTMSLHLPICVALEKRFIKDVWELPRDHFKSTICSEGLPVWWSLYVTKQDQDEFSKWGYPDEFIRWMMDIHNPDIRILLVSENLTNASKLGYRIKYHFESNAVYRALFPETLPDASCTWSNISLHIRRPPGGTGAGHGEGTFDFLGVGGALQSRHYHRVVQDDLIGRKAIESQTVMDKSIEYHKLLIGAFETEDKDHEESELIVGNRWSYHDLNSHMRENESWFELHSHSALGGCCALHAPDTPVFPEEFSYNKLMRIRERLGGYHFSCQFLNNPSAPEDADFKEEWLNKYKLAVDGDGRAVIAHIVKNGTVKKDLRYGHFNICMVSDPNHSGNAASGRCRHSIVVLGMSPDGHYYLLDCWASRSSYDTYIGKIFDMAKKWRLNRFGLETIAAQRYLAYHIQYRNRMEGRTLRIIELKGEVEAPDGTITRNKEWRIRNVLSPIFESGAFWCQDRHQDFIGEYTTFPKGKYCDILDAMAYAPQMLKAPLNHKEFMESLEINRKQSELVGQAYSVLPN